MHAVYYCTSKHSLLLVVISLPATSNLPQHPPNQPHIKTTSLHIRSTCISYVAIKSSNHQIKPSRSKSKKTLAKSTNRLCALHSRTTHLPNANKILPSHVSDARPSLSRIATTKIELASPNPHPEPRIHQWGVWL